MKMKIRQAFLWAACLALLSIGIAAAEPAAARTEGASYVLQAAELAAIADETLSGDVVFGNSGLALREGALTGAYVSLPITMDEFTQVTVTVDAQTPAGGRMPLVEMSVYQPETSGWGEWTLLPDGKTAGRDKGSGQTALIRYRITLTRADGAQPGPTLHSVTVSAKAPGASSTYLILLIVIALGLFLPLYGRTLQRKAPRRK